MKWKHPGLWGVCWERGFFEPELTSEWIFPRGSKIRQKSSEHRPHSGQQSHRCGKTAHTLALDPAAHSLTEALWPNSVEVITVCKRIK